MRAEERLRAALRSIEVDDGFTQADVGLDDGSLLRFRHRVGERTAQAIGQGVAEDLLARMAMFRLNRKHLEVLFSDGSRWEVYFGG
ncbi:MAG: hypothetical protein KatS3mg105_1143 [Gemmatales bacterium]|nr:MAG: hypothetical protein KatS3mg105_1143 [Gemmatales bacterium]